MSLMAPAKKARTSL